MSEKVMVLGAGMVVQPLVGCLLKNNLTVTIASRTLSKAEKAINHHPFGKALDFMTK